MRLTGLRLLALLSALALSHPAAAGEDVMMATTHSSFADVKLEVSDAIISRGLAIDHTGKIGEMLERTGKAVGATKHVYKAAEAIQFCSAVLSRKMMEADPANIAYCPFIVFFYERADEPGTVHVGHRRLTEDGSAASKAALKEINALLDAIVRQATGG